MKSEPQIEKELAFRTGYVEAFSERGLSDEFMNGYKAALEWVLEWVLDDEDE